MSLDKCPFFCHFVHVAKEENTEETTNIRKRKQDTSEGQPRKRTRRQESADSDVVIVDEGRSEGEDKGNQEDSATTGRRLSLRNRSRKRAEEAEKHAEEAEKHAETEKENPAKMESSDSAEKTEQANSGIHIDFYVDLVRLQDYSVGFGTCILCPLCQQQA